MSRPRIGITTSLNEGEQRLDRLYVQAIEQAGGLPVIVPILDTEEARDEFVAILDGLVVTGGPAITDGLVGELPDDIATTDPVRVESDKAIIGAFMKSRRPVLGICYGMQMLNALHGGTIYADIERQRSETTIHSEKRGGVDHAVKAAPSSLLGDLLGSQPFTVNTRHIQAVAEVGGGLVASLHAPDGCIEGIEAVGGLVVGVQFHPERMGSRMAPLFEALVERARKKDKAEF
jgi:putative glutamine amidotransferase